MEHTDTSEFGVGDIIRITRIHWRRVAMLFFGTAVAVFLLLLFTAGREYRASAVFAPQATDELGSSRLLGLAAQLGFTAPVAGGSETLQFYVRLIKSRELLREVATSTFPSSSSSKTFVQLKGFAGDSEEERTKSAVAALQESVAVAPDLEANVIEVRTTDTDADLAVAITSRILELVDTFNRSHRSSAVRAEREFVQQRLSEAKQDLTVAEENLESFLEQNRTFQSSPQLSLQEERLQREIDLRREIHVSLAQSYERSRIEEVRNTPVITVIDSPEGSLERAIGTKLIVALSLLGAGGVSVAGIGAIAVRSRTVGQP